MLANVFGFLMVGTLLATIVMTVILFVKKKVKRGFKTLGMGLLGVFALAFVLGVVSPDTPEQKAEKAQEAAHKAQEAATAKKEAQDKKDAEKAAKDAEKAKEAATAKKEAAQRAEENKKLNGDRAKFVDYGMKTIEYYNSLSSPLDKYNYAKREEDKCLEYFNSTLSKDDEDFQGMTAVGRSAWIAVQKYLEDPGNVAKLSKANEAVTQYQVLLAQAGQKYQAK